MSDVEKILTREGCRKVMAEWVRCLMKSGQMTPTAFAVSLTESFQRIYGDGPSYDHDRQRLFKSCVSKWKKGVQSPSIENCCLLDDVRRSIEVECRAIDSDEARARLSELKRLAAPSIVELRTHLDSLPRERLNSKPKSYQAESQHGVDLDGPINTTMQALLVLLKQAVLETRVGLGEDPEQLVTGVDSHFTEGPRSQSSSGDNKRQVLSQQIGELVLTILEENTPQPTQAKDRETFSQP